jgi:hypothetical protein
MKEGISRRFFSRGFKWGFKKLWKKLFEKIQKNLKKIFKSLPTEPQKNPISSTRNLQHLILKNKKKINENFSPDSKRLHFSFFSHLLK